MAGTLHIIGFRQVSQIQRWTRVESILHQLYGDVIMAFDILDPFPTALYDICVLVVMKVQVLPGSLFGDATDSSFYLRYSAR